MGVLLYKLCYYTCPFEDSPMAILGGRYRLPTMPAYSIKVKNLIRKPWLLGVTWWKRQKWLIFTFSYSIYGTVLTSPTCVANRVDPPPPELLLTSDPTMRPDASALLDIAATYAGRTQPNMPPVRVRGGGVVIEVAIFWIFNRGKPCTTKQISLQKNWPGLITVTTRWQPNCCIYPPPSWFRFLFHILMFQFYPPPPPQVPGLVVKYCRGLVDQPQATKHAAPNPVNPNVQAAKSNVPATNPNASAVSVNRPVSSSLVPNHLRLCWNKWNHFSASSYITYTSIWYRYDIDIHLESHGTISYICI
mgnify:CR=1 FL=1